MKITAEDVRPFLRDYKFKIQQGEENTESGKGYTLRIGNVVKCIISEEGKAYGCLHGEDIKKLCYETANEYLALAKYTIQGKGVEEFTIRKSGKKMTNKEIIKDLTKNIIP